MDASPTSNYDPDLNKDAYEPGAKAGEILQYLAWIVSACAVGGVITVGTQMALQLRRGEPGEGAGYFRGLVIVFGACILGATAGPLVQFVIRPYLI
ncbi:hypothetical protein KDA82_15235 [Streptomyces daliensis]|uniref:Uncharacterized protein n=1 Tax=Streptomyces daliensis TaxID=299421 RepID=A0A8T4IWS6_9ACTN|nr:hypothetical protein [Streptomyces daliensis]